MVSYQLELDLHFPSTANRMGLPKVGDILSTDKNEFRLYVLAVDIEENIWTCVEEITGIIRLQSFDENNNSLRLEPDLENCFSED